MDTMPSPPALATAAARRGVASAPRPACCIGTEQPTNSVNLVLSIVSLLSRCDSGRKYGLLEGILYYMGDGRCTALTLSSVRCPLWITLWMFYPAAIIFYPREVQEWVD